ncbi:MAG: MBL fold metallo-hydrolase [Chlamydiales bacterium]|nr:MBL fold metallo-hydrolase [Chlamydiia bacterium]MCP5507599.1 MBL fold metallo-hydrolase [Chlamydiales bacterium]
MKGFCPLASGSKGNSIYLGTDQTKVLIDAGISTRATRLRLAEIGVDLADIDAILITHDHTDHIQGLKVMAMKMGIPVFANAETAKGIVDQLQDCPKFKIFSTGETFEFGDLEIHPFSIQHDTLDPVAFTIRMEELKLGFCTDLGFVTSLVRAQLQECDYLYVESNHCRNMVDASSRPMVYKQRVKSRTGHLSNEECGQLLLDVYHDGLKHVHLAHLSSECNSPEKAVTVIKKMLHEQGVDVELSTAYQDRISKPIYFADESAFALGVN